MTNDDRRHLTSREWSAIWRAGRRAAATGHAWTHNPFLRRENMPGVTGEELKAWSAKHDMWQRGFESDASAAIVGGTGAFPPAILLRQVLDRVRRSFD